ncbi:MAG TPA: CidB/LrgB family autolysis modulator [Arsenophonus nasoniae]|uniref:CidB/LrgB family autolysis modulator n=1 Tax=Arsenophonus nasoniae TaxID=638 RepID=UPI003879766F
MLNHIWWSLPFTIIVFLLARKLFQKFKLIILNPLLISIGIIIPVLLITQTSYDHYFSGSRILNDLLQSAVVALALPLYEQLHQIRAQWKSIISICFIGSLIAMITGTTIALWTGATVEMAASILPKSVTTPIAMAVSEAIGGVPAISAACVILVGIFGAMFGQLLFNFLQIKNPIARGLAMGAASHAVGTARSAEIDYIEGAYSSLALMTCGIITSLIAPFIFPLLIQLLH